VTFYVAKSDCCAMWPRVSYVRGRCADLWLMKSDLCGVVVGICLGDRLDSFWYCSVGIAKRFGIPQNGVFSVEWGFTN